MCSGDFASINTHNMTNPTTLQNVTAPTKLSIPGITLVSDWADKSKVRWRHLAIPRSAPGHHLATFT